MKRLLAIAIAVVALSHAPVKGATFTVASGGGPDGPYDWAVSVGLTHQTTGKTIPLGLVFAGELRTLSVPAGTYTLNMYRHSTYLNYIQTQTYTVTLGEKQSGFLSWYTVGGGGFFWSLEVVDMPASGAAGGVSEATVLWLVLAAGFFCGWMLLSPLET